MHNKIKVAVLMGGKSQEHEISLISGSEVAKNLDRKKYNVSGITIPKEGINHPIIAKLKKADIVFIALHGTNGEDGTIQGLLESLGVRYTGSGVLASALGMDKIYSREIFTQTGLNTPKYVLTKRNQKKRELGRLKYPVFVKPLDQGSSIGTSKVYNSKELQNALSEAFKYSQTAIIEEFLEGIEITGAVLGNYSPVALPLVEIVPKKDFFDYEAKYDANLTDEIVPARVNKQLTKRVQDAALTAYESINCRGFGRVDMIIKDDKVYVLEVNTIPGLTPVSLFPKAAKAAGISYSRLLDMIIDLAFKS
ncbi:MAG: D-alanine--D-alanine ligase [Candidatus Curtissbacteria bacterium]|nr:D-alanine--D-alanine ligase [Candidatus Curtissbacteria bacterium]